MKPASAARTTLIGLFVSLALAGCGSDSNEMSQQDIQYMSHLDQSRFFQRQGELKASTLEARSAIELRPDQVEPYFLIVDNLLDAGDAANAERQLKQVLEIIPKDQIDSKVRNRAQLILARSNLLQGDFDDALEALEKIASPDRPMETQAELVKGRIYLTSERLNEARDAFRRAQELDPGEVESLVGLSKTAFVEGDVEAASSLIAEAEKIDGAATELWLWKAQFAAANKEWPKAEDAYIRALEDIGQYDVMTQRKYATISELIRVLRAQGKQSEAFVYEQILAKSAPGTIKSNLSAAQEAFEQDDLESAARYLEEVLEQAPNHEQTALMLGLVRFRQGRIDEAEKLLAPIAEAGNSEIASKLLAATRLKMRNPMGAKEVLDAIDNKQSDPETLAMVAIASLTSGDFETGESLMEEALALAPNNHDLRLQYSAYLIQRGEYERAIAQSNKVRENAPTMERARGLIIDAHVQAGDMASAIKVATEWMKDHPNSVLALLVRGNLAARSGDFQDARQYFSEAQESAPDSPSGVIALGRLSLDQGDRAQAQEYFRRAVELAPDNRDALEGLARVLDRKEMERVMLQIVEEKPNATGPRLLLLEIALTEGNSQQADRLTASLLNRSEQNTPSSAESFVAGVYSSVATALLNSNEPNRASEVLTRALALFPRNETIALQNARKAFSEGREDDARKILQETKQKHPESGQPYAVEAAFFENQKQHQQAAELYQLALQKNQSAEFASGYARNLQRLGKPEEALRFLESATKDYPGSNQLMLSLAMLQQANGEEGAAQQHYETLLSRMPDNVVVLNNLAWLYHENDDDRAMDLARRAYNLQPENASIADTYGWIMFKQGYTSQSIEILEKAHGLQPESEDIALHLAEAYRALGKNSEAQRLLEKFNGRG
ncbi:MAG: hypothetical protein CME36_15100 [unclassified Hahellaceae]|nr:hypothetical protein [Hahellaceae bacterium]|tara:strand:- start:22262 stop:24961 length:2700 start_codon:yes stop_codon:yes gene_type:complete